jgi:hypothetical protein
MPLAPAQATLLIPNAGSSEDVMNKFRVWVVLAERDSRKASLGRTTLRPNRCWEGEAPAEPHITAN